MINTISSHHFVEDASLKVCPFLIETKRLTIIFNNIDAATIAVSDHRTTGRIVVHDCITPGRITVPDSRTTGFAYVGSYSLRTDRCRH